MMISATTRIKILKTKLFASTKKVGSTHINNRLGKEKNVIKNKMEILFAIDIIV